MAILRGCGAAFRLPGSMRRTSPGSLAPTQWQVFSRFQRARRPGRSSGSSSASFGTKSRRWRRKNRRARNSNGRNAPESLRCAGSRSEPQTLTGRLTCSPTLGGWATAMPACWTPTCSRCSRRHQRKFRPPPGAGSIAPPISWIWNRRRNIGARQPTWTGAGFRYPRHSSLPSSPRRTSQPCLTASSCATRRGRVVPSLSLR